MGRDAGQARGVARLHVGADVSAGAGEHDGQVRDVGGHERGRGAGRHDPGHDEHDGSGIRIRLVDRIERMPHHGVEAGRSESPRDEILLRVGDRLIAVQRHGTADGRTCRERAAEAGKQSRRVVVGRCAESTGERHEGCIGDPPLELAHHA